MGHRRGIYMVGGTNPKIVYIDLFLPGRSIVHKFILTLDSKCAIYATMGMIPIHKPTRCCLGGGIIHDLKLTPDLKGKLDLMPQAQQASQKPSVDLSGLSAPTDSQLSDSPNLSTQQVRALRQIVGERLVNEEGYRLRPYKDSTGNWTCGVGHNLSSHCSKEELSAILKAGTVSKEQVIQWLRDDLNTAINDCYVLFGNFPSLNIARQSVLVDMAFNMGYIALSGFRRLMKAVAMEDWSLAKESMLQSLWAKQVGHRATILAEIILRGELS